MRLLTARAIYLGAWATGSHRGDMVFQVSAIPHGSASERLHAGIGPPPGEGVTGPMHRLPSQTSIADRYASLAALKWVAKPVRWLGPPKSVPIVRPRTTYSHAL
jgi:hypothetical protein